MINGNAADSIIRNVFFFKTGCYLSRSSVKYMKSNTQELLDNDELMKTKDMSSADIMINKCEEKNMIILYCSKTR